MICCDDPTYVLRDESLLDSEIDNLGSSAETRAGFIKVTPILAQGTLNVTDDTSDDLVSIAQGGPNLWTLAINSVSTRSEEQIHVYVGDHPGSPARGILDKLHRENPKITSSVNLSALPKPSAAMSCQAPPNKGRGIVDRLTQ
ncbi:unnamed protein product [Penicillium palitans]